MLPEAITEPVRGLLSICVIVAALDSIAESNRSALSFRSLCALASAVCVCRAVMRFLE